MKHKIKIGVLLLSLFLLVGCDKIPTDIIDQLPDGVVDLLPSINIIGEEIIEVEQYADFTDPGVEVTGDFDLVISTVSNIDTSILGDQTITYSIEYNGITYNGSRIVRVVEPFVPFDFLWTINKTTITHDSIGVFISFTDTDGLLQNGKGALYQGETLIASYDLISGDNYMTFSGLQGLTDYKFVTEGTYEKDGVTVSLSNTELELKTEELTSMSFSLTNEDITHNSYTVDIGIDSTSSNIQTRVAYLYLGENIVKETTFDSVLNTFTTEGLLPNTEYVLKVIYTGITSNDILQPVTEVLHTFSTDSLPGPGFVMLLCDVYFTNAECVVGISSEGLTDISLRVEVYIDDVYDSEFQVEYFNTYVDIINLDPGLEYDLKLYVDYKIEGNDELIVNTLLHETTITTQEMETYTTPYVENLVITPVIGSINSVTFTFDVVDPDNTIIGNVVFKLDPFISSTGQLIDVGHNEIVITGYPIYDNITYTFLVSTDYNVDEENSEYSEVIYEESFLTAPDVAGVSYTSNQSMYFHGERFIMILEIENDDDLNVEYVTVNGNKIYKDDFLFPSNDHIIYLNMGVETDYTDYTYHVTDFAVTMSDESSYPVAYDQTLSFRLQQPGDIDPDDAYVSVLEITTDDFTRLVTSGTNKTEVTIRLDNKYNLEVATITVSGEIYSVPDFKEGTTSKQIILDVEIDRYSNYIYINSLVYVKNTVILLSEDYSAEPISIYGYYSEDSVAISTPAELNSIDTSENKYYYLTQDIDLTDFPMEPIGTSSSPFYGIFDGNGYTISNYTYTSLEVDQGDYVYLGLFGKSYGFLYDIKMTYSNILVNTNENHELYIGILVGYSGGKIIDCSTALENTITVNGIIQGAIGGLAGVSVGFVRDASANTDIIIDGLNIDKGSSYNTRVGGLIGIAGRDNVETSSALGTITITNTVNNSNNVGGLIGVFENDTSDYTTRNYITNSFASVDISTTNYGGSSGGSVGGLVGTVRNGYADNSEIINSYATGDIYSERGYIGGLIGNSFAYITNSFATGNIDRAGGSANTVASNGYDTFLTNCYFYDTQTLSYNGEPGFISDDIEGHQVAASSEEYNNDDFYLRVLGWDTYFWNFDTMIVTADIMPIHK